jgi:hypothetical protein
MVRAWVLSRGDGLAEDPEFSSLGVGTVELGQVVDHSVSTSDDEHCDDNTK